MISCISCISIWPKSKQNSLENFCSMKYDVLKSKIHCIQHTIDIIRTQNWTLNSIPWIDFICCCARKPIIMMLMLAETTLKTDRVTRDERNLSQSNSITDGSNFYSRSQIDFPLDWLQCCLFIRAMETACWQPLCMVKVIIKTFIWNNRTHSNQFRMHQMIMTKRSIVSESNFLEFTVKTDPWF